MVYVVFVQRGITQLTDTGWGRSFGSSATGHGRLSDRVATNEASGFRKADNVLGLRHG